MNGEGFRVTQEVVGDAIEVRITMPVPIAAALYENSLEHMPLDVSGIEALEYIMHFAFGTAALMCEGTDYPRVGLKLREIAVKIDGALKLSKSEEERNDGRGDKIHCQSKDC